MNATSIPRWLFLVVFGIGTGLVQGFPLDPVRIHFGGTLARTDRTPITEPQELIFSVWQGGSENELDSGRLLYREKVTVRPEPDGHFFVWLGAGEVLHGQLRGAPFGLDKTLFLQTAYEGPDGKVRKRFPLHAIADAYVTRGAVTKAAPRRVEPIARFIPDFTTEKPEMMRRPRARLYPDGYIQTPGGALIPTTGSRTAGVQELLDYCVRHHVDGYIVGGSEPHGQQVVYHINEPVRLAPFQGFSLDTGAVALYFGTKGQPLGDRPAFTIDSCMMVDIRIRGLILNIGKGYALAIQPRNLLPLDTFVGPTIVDTSVYVTAIATRGKGVLFDGSINFSRFTFNEINGGDIGVHVSPTAGFSNNRFTCKHVHGQRRFGLLIEAGSGNVWEVNYSPDARDPRPIVTNATNDFWIVNAWARTQPVITLQENASGNQFRLLGLGGGYENWARQPTNRFYLAPSGATQQLGVGFSLATPDIPASGVPVVNREPFPVGIIVVDPGSVNAWSLTDVYGANRRIEAPLNAGQSLSLHPGESVTLYYEGRRPRWVWRGLP